MRFEPFASSSEGNLYRVSDGQTVLLIECGLPFRQLQFALDFEVSSLAGCLVSHAHADHSRGAVKLAGAGIEVYASVATLNAIGLGTHHRARPVVARRAFRIGSFHITAFELVHDAPCLGFYLRSGNEALVYVSDTIYCPVRFPPATIYAVETNYDQAILMERLAAGIRTPEQVRRTIQNHLSLHQAIAMLKANDLSRAREIHLLHLSDGSSDEAAFRKEVERQTGVPTFVAPTRREPWI